METLFSYVAPPTSCGYLPDQSWQLEYEHVAAMSAAEYMERMLQGWRRFGHVLFRPQCPSCKSCQPLRVVVDQFRPDRSQRRARRTNEGITQLKIGVPAVTRSKLSLYDRFHAYQSATKDWPIHPPQDAYEFFGSFVNNPFPTEEWCYFVEGKLAGVGYVDVLSQGMSAIYFFYEPAIRELSPGIWNVLSILEQAARRKLPHVYLGYYVAGCPSMTYKCKFRPNQVRDLDGEWRDFMK
jgi:arginyl-tRNA--protein-N-Asp/Glu arginylyltransferase